MELSKSDWKLYIEKMAGWQENHIKKDDRLIIILDAWQRKGRLMRKE